MKLDLKLRKTVTELERLQKVEKISSDGENSKIRVKIQIFSKNADLNKIFICFLLFEITTIELLLKFAFERGAESYGLKQLEIILDGGKFGSKFKIFH